LISVRSIVSAAEFCVHYNGIFTRDPHNRPPSSDGAPVTRWPQFN
jgi:hypothetical protein